MALPLPCPLIDAPPLPCPLTNVELHDLFLHSVKRAGGSLEEEVDDHLAWDIAAAGQLTSGEGMGLHYPVVVTWIPVSLLHVIAMNVTC